MICPNPPSPGNLIPSPLPPRGLFGAPLPPNMLRGPPPAVDRSVWLGSPGFPPGGIGSERSAGGCPPHHLGLAPHSLLPQQNRHILHASDPSAHRARGRRPDRSPKQGDSRFELDIERVLRGEDPRTTLMIKNIPNKYASSSGPEKMEELSRFFPPLPREMLTCCLLSLSALQQIHVGDALGRPRRAPPGNVRFPLSAYRFQGESEMALPLIDRHNVFLTCLAPSTRLRGRALLILDPSRTSATWAMRSST